MIDFFKVVVLYILIIVTMKFSYARVFLGLFLNIKMHDDNNIHRGQQNIERKNLTNGCIVVIIIIIIIILLLLFYLK